MRTRSSRFFVILLHLVGVSHHLPVTWQNNGIVGVHPWPIVLETVLVEELIDTPQEPVWLQDSIDKQCLGPTGTFTECGDATLWFVVRKTLQAPAGADKRRLRMGLFGVEEVQTRKEEAWSFQVVDRDYPEDESGIEAAAASVKQSFWKRRRRKATEADPVECLLSNAPSNVQVQSCAPPKKQKRSSTPASSSLQQRNNAWAWNVNSDGVFRSMASMKDQKLLPHKEQCLWRGNGTQALLDDCGTSNPNVGADNSKSNQRKVKFSVVRYRAVTVSAAAATSVSPASISSLKDESAADASEDDETETAPDHLPSNKAMSNRAASEHLPFALLKDTNPILLMQHTNIGGGTGALRKDVRRAGGGVSRTPSLVHSRDASDDVGSIASHKKAPRRMAVHPYIAAATNEVWTDPATGLEYFTDLVQYLGWDRKEHGRHTLVGVGQYRKGYVIKVYGIAYYVSKRHVLDAPVFEPYAGMTADELRNTPEFYKVLRNMHPPNHAMFDRTILLKINMQISAETMRSSLQADWKFLTEEAKSTMINSSLEPRPANEDMLKVITSPQNPSRCSCSQVAPEEYQADPSCCARGTELGFTWKRSGHLEIRINGRLMDSFARPDIAEGIFYEYLRTDDPISPELRDRVVDGFPFLLAPLERAKDFQASASPHKTQELGNPIFRVFSGIAEYSTSHAAALVSMVHTGTFEMAGNAMNAARSFGDVVHNVGSEIDRRRGLIVKHAVALPETAMHLLSRDKDPLQTVTDWVVGNATPEDSEELPTRKVSPGRVFGYPLSRWFSDTYHAPDEIGPMKIRPTMTMRRKIFLTLVHLYLLLLLIVSFPGSYTTRTKLVARKKEVDDESKCKETQNRALGKGAQERLQCQEGSFTRVSFLSRARKALGANNSDELEEDDSPPASANGTPLKKKSLSYFL